ncbi:MAG: hypothetical protein JJV92_02345 [Desulfosarcina sp.]|nr:hypothetical protein [Desulfobacterales bacterium]
MKQKFIMGKNNKNGLEIQEYSELEKDQFFLVYTHVYDSEEIESAIEKGNKDIIETLRNDNFFPYRNYIDQIAETVKEIYASNIENSVEVSFDDQEYNIEEPEEVELSDEIEKLLEEDVVSTDVTNIENEGVAKTNKPQKD